MNMQVTSSLRRLFKRVKSISRVCRWVFAISINFRLVRFLWFCECALIAIFRVKNDEG